MLSQIGSAQPPHYTALQRFSATDIFRASRLTRASNERVLKAETFEFEPHLDRIWNLGPFPGGKAQPFPLGRAQLAGSSHEKESFESDVI